MSSIVTAAIRTALQSWWGIVAGWLASLGIAVSDEQSVVVLGILTAVGIGLVTAGIRWLESQRGDGIWPSLARRVAQVLMLGITAQPTYEQSTAKAPVRKASVKPEDVA